MGKGSSWDSLVRLMLCGSLILSSAAPLSADETTTITTGTTLFDSYLQQDAAATNNGNAATMFVQSRNNGTARNRRAVVEWDLTASGIPATAAVKIANMKLTLSVAPTPAQGSRNHEAHVLTGAPNWTGTTVTWNNRTGGSPWTTAGGDFHAASASTQATGTTNNAVITWPLLSDGTYTNIGQTWLSTPANNLGILIKDSVEDAPVAGVAG
ncbi:MAG: DNRLRE domain-containing protein, partial [Acidobacteria bacterium]|nr:DNRLRE domain-containing protein [Acidobacteriota bacterium]